jgi:hypothetical protein
MWLWLATAPWKGASALSAIYVTWTQKAVNGKPARLLDQHLGMKYKSVPFDSGYWHANTSIRHGPRMEGASQ